MVLLHCSDPLIDTHLHQMEVQIPYCGLGHPPQSVYYLPIPTHFSLLLSLKTPVTLIPREDNNAPNTPPDCNVHPTSVKPWQSDFTFCLSWKRLYNAH